MSAAGKACRWPPWSAVRDRICGTNAAVPNQFR